jgi:hypothetical protein
MPFRKVGVFKEVFFSGCEGLTQLNALRFYFENWVMMRKLETINLTRRKMIVFRRMDPLMMVLQHKLRAFAG